jgi:uncharacterized protein (TIGR00730 family)
MVSNGISLVYGGASVGIMGVLADTVLAEGGEVVGVLPRDLFAKEVGHDGLTQLHLVGSMHERKAQMAELADGFIALPGGLGTFEELFETVTWSQLGLHRKPCGLLNLCGYYDHLTAFLDHSVEEEFVKAQHRSALIVEKEPEALLERFESYQPPEGHKWVERRVN